MQRRSYNQETGSGTVGFTDCSLTRARCTGEGTNGREGKSASICLVTLKVVLQLLASVFSCLSISIGSIVYTL